MLCLAAALVLYAAAAAQGPPRWDPEDPSMRAVGCLACHAVFDHYDAALRYPLLKTVPPRPPAAAAQEYMDTDPCGTVYIDDAYHAGVCEAVLEMVDADHYVRDAVAMGNEPDPDLRMAACQRWCA
eukprot:TRINITY_DN30452_c0_g1_i1.p2 TRINITY_DN30452_c0_g1~~TRINITY_DN30452_c0_g1_i1.p2  ORF type:complete len:126 (+),score=36.35 TRINITY_DN30452_c0_g1_i1:25-402(+)